MNGAEALDRVSQQPRGMTLVRRHARAMQCFQHALDARVVGYGFKRFDEARLDRRKHGEIGTVTQTAPLDGQISLHAFSFSLQKSEHGHTSAAVPTAGTLRSKCSPKRSPWRPTLQSQSTDPGVLHFGLETVHKGEAVWSPPSRRYTLAPRGMSSGQGMRHVCLCC